MNEFSQAGFWCLLISAIYTSHEKRGLGALTGGLAVMCFGASVASALLEILT